MKIPKQFVLHGHTINIKIIEHDNNNRYGYYDSVREEITIARKVEVDGILVELNDTQIEHTVWHEVFHTFQWHTDGETDETEAQSYAGLMIEFLKTSGLKIDPNIVHTPIHDECDEHIE